MSIDEKRLAREALARLPAALMAIPLAEREERWDLVRGVLKTTTGNAAASLLLGSNCAVSGLVIPANTDTGVDLARALSTNTLVKFAKVEVVLRGSELPCRFATCMQYVLCARGLRKVVVEVSEKLPELVQGDEEPDEDDWGDGLLYFSAGSPTRDSLLAAASAIRPWLASLPRSSDLKVVVRRKEIGGSIGVVLTPALCQDQLEAGAAVEEAKLPRSAAYSKDIYSSETACPETSPAEEAVEGELVRLRDKPRTWLVVEASGGRGQVAIVPLGENVGSPQQRSVANAHLAFARLAWPLWHVVDTARAAGAVSSHQEAMVRACRLEPVRRAVDEFVAGQVPL